MSVKTDLPLPEASQVGESSARPSSFLANKQLWLLYSGQAITNASYYLYVILLTVWVFDLTHSGVTISMVLGATSLSPFLLGPLAGVCIDRWNRQTVVVSATLVLAVVPLLPLPVPASLRLPAIYLSALLASAASSCIMPAKSGILQAIVPERHQTQAAYWSAALFTLSTAGGAAFAAQLYFLAGPPLALLLIVALFGLAALLWRLIHLPMTTRLEASALSLTSGIATVGQDLVQGLRFVVRTPSLRKLLLCASLVMACASIFNAANLVFVTQRLQVATSAIGPVNVSISIGTLIGALVAGLLVRWIAPRYVFAGGMLLLGIGVIIYAQLTWYTLALVWIGVAVFPQSGLDVGLGPILLASSPPHIIGRTQSVIESSMLLSAFVATFLEGALIQAVPVAVLVASAGGLAFLAGIVACWGLVWQPAQRHATEGQPQVQDERA